MREIKFRAWDKKYDRMIGVNAWHFDTGIIDASEHGELRGFRDDGNFDVMQFTGLKDKNGKEIYEGDILITGSNKQIYGVEYVENGASFIFTKIVGDVDSPSVQLSPDRDKRKAQVETLEVIGNIYENPELLKA